MKASLFWRFSHWDLALPLTTRESQGRAVRTVLQLRLECERASVTSEAAPLPGLHHEGVEDLPALLPRALLALDAVRTVGGDRAVLTSLEHQLRRHQLPPSLVWALGWAWSEASGLVSTLPEDAPSSAALLAGTPHSWVEEWREAGAPEVVKVKVGRCPMEEEVRALRTLAHQAPGMELRLDANAAWSLEEALAFEEACAPLVPAFVEDPLARSQDLAPWRLRSGWPLALDASLGRQASEDVPEEGAAAWVLKAQVLGLDEVLARMERARQLGRAAPRIIISSCFESPRGLQALRRLAALAPGRPAPGLGTERWFTGKVRDEAWRQVEPRS